MSDGTLTELGMREPREWSVALALCQRYGIGKATLRKWQESNTDGLCFHPPGRSRRRLYRRSVLLRLCGVE